MPKSFTYIKSDLDRIYIRAIGKDGKWGNASLSELTNKQFLDWVGSKFGLGHAMGSYDFNYTAQDKVDLLNSISLSLGRPCVVMLKRNVKITDPKKNGTQKGGEK